MKDPGETFETHPSLVSRKVALVILSEIANVRGILYFARLAINLKRKT